MAIYYRESPYAPLAELLGSIGGACIRCIMRKRALKGREQLYAQEGLPPTLAREPIAAQNIILKERKLRALSQQEETAAYLHQSAITQQQNLQKLAYIQKRSHEKNEIMLLIAIFSAMFIAVLFLKKRKDFYHS